MEKMLRTFLLFLIALSLSGTGVAQAIAQVTKQTAAADLVQITICSTDQTPVTILIDRNGNKAPAPVECDYPNCMNCLSGSAFQLSDPIGVPEHDRKVVLTIFPMSFDHAGATPTAPATARAPLHKV